MIWFATWSRIAGEEAKMREFLLTANAKNYKIFECALVHLVYTSYRGTYENINPVGESIKLERKGG